MSIVSFIALLTLLPIITVTSKRLQANIGEDNTVAAILRIMVCVNIILVCILLDFFNEEKAILLIGVIIFGIVNLAILIFGPKLPDNKKALIIVVIAYILLMLLIPFYSIEDQKMVAKDDSPIFIGGEQYHFPDSYSLGDYLKYYNCYHIKIFETELELGPSFYYDL